MSAPLELTGEEWCAMEHDHTASREQREVARVHCNQMTHHNLQSMDQMLSLFGGFLGTADQALNSEMALEETDTTYGDWHQPGASHDAVEHGHNMQHSDIALRAIGSMLGYSHTMMQHQY